MIYEYHCQEHGTFEVYKPMDEAHTEEVCPTCKTPSVRIWANRGGFYGEKVEHPEWNPALGCVTKNSRHAKQIADSRGLVEIGNEKPDTVHKEMNAIIESNRNRSYDEALNGL